jgi:hypothetical protein
MSAAQSLVTAMLAALRADTTLAADLGSRIHDAAPRDPVFPHLVVADVTVRDRSGVDATLEEVRATLEVFSRAGGRAEAARIAERVETVLLAATLSPAGRRVALLRSEATETTILRDRVTVRAAVRFVALLEPV